jgi:hypothetical protein
VGTQAKTESLEQFAKRFYLFANYEHVSFWLLVKVDRLWLNAPFAGFNTAAKRFIS